MRVFRLLAVFLLAGCLGSGAPKLLLDDPDNPYASSALECDLFNTFSVDFVSEPSMRGSVRCFFNDSEYLSCDLEDGGCTASRLCDIGNGTRISLECFLFEPGGARLEETMLVVPVLSVVKEANVSLSCEMISDTQAECTFVNYGNVGVERCARVWFLDAGLNSNGVETVCAEIAPGSEATATTTSLLPLGIVDVDYLLFVKPGSLY